MSETLKSLLSIKIEGLFWVITAQQCSDTWELPVLKHLCFTVSKLDKCHSHKQNCCSWTNATPTKSGKAHKNFSWNGQHLPLSHSTHVHHFIYASRSVRKFQPATPMFMDSYSCSLTTSLTLWQSVMTTIPHLLEHNITTETPLWRTREQ